MKSRNITYLYRITLIVVSVSIIFGIAHIVSQNGDDPKVEELFEGTFAYNFEDGECRYFEDGEELSEGFEKINASNIEVGEICTTYDQLYELKLEFESQEQMDEELRSEGLSAIENGDLTKAKIIEARTEGYLSYIVTILPVYSTKILLSVLTLLTVIALNHSIKALIQFKVKSFTESSIRAIKKDSNINEKLLRDLVEVDEKVIDGDHISAYLEYRKLKNK